MSDADIANKFDDWTKAVQYVREAATADRYSLNTEQLATVLNGAGMESAAAQAKDEEAAQEVEKMREDEKKEAESKPAGSNQEIHQVKKELTEVKKENTDLKAKVNDQKNTINDLNG